MTPEKIAETRQQASVTFLSQVWEQTAQIGMQRAADLAHCQALLTESQEALAVAQKRVEELEANLIVPVDNA